VKKTLDPVGGRMARRVRELCVDRGSLTADASIRYIIGEIRIFS
jgi:hypothetical protein